MTISSWRATSAISNSRNFGTSPRRKHIDSSRSPHCTSVCLPHVFDFFDPHTFLCSASLIFSRRSISHFLVRISGYHIRFRLFPIMERVVVEPPPKRQKTEVSPDPQPFAHGYQGPPTGDVVAEHARAATEDGGAQSKPVNRAASSSEQSGDVVNSPVPNHGAGGSSSSAKNDASFSIEVLRPGSGVSSGEHFSVYFGVSAEMFIFSYPVASKTLTARQLKDFLLGSGTVDTVWGEAGKPPHHQFVLLREREDGEEKTAKKSEDDVEEEKVEGKEKAEPHCTMSYFLSTR